MNLNTNKYSSAFLKIEISAAFSLTCYVFSDHGEK